MERIKLTKAEKRVLRELRRGSSCVPEGMDNYTFFDTVVTLTEKRLIESKTNYDEVIAAKLAPKGYAYINANPNLHNPVDWVRLITLILAAVTAVSTTLALFVGCMLINK